MKLSELKNKLTEMTEINFQLPNGTFVPQNFHVTEVGQINKQFIDCGGTIRKEKVVNFQLWEAGDVDHRLTPEKLKSIISLSEKILEIEDAEIEVEYQNETIGKYGLAFDENVFLLTTKNTNCLASNKCGTNEKSKIHLSELQNTHKTCCTSDGGCC